MRVAVSVSSRRGCADPASYSQVQELGCAMSAEEEKVERRGESWSSRVSHAQANPIPELQEPTSTQVP